MTAESEALDRIAQLVAQQYPKGTEDPTGKALRHELHKAGRLNEPKYRYIVLVPFGVKDGTGIQGAHHALTNISKVCESALAFDGNVDVLEGGDFVAFRDVDSAREPIYLSQRVDPKGSVRFSTMGWSLEGFRKEVADDDNYL